mgnify:CR=1 FL=1
MKKHQKRREELALIPRYKRLDECLSLLLKLGKKNVIEVSKEDLLNDKLVGLTALKDLSPVFANFHKWGFLKENPFLAILNQRYVSSKNEQSR